jgi:hypothetical protein
MSIAEKLRQAAGYFVELPPEEKEIVNKKTPLNFSHTTEIIRGATSDTATDDTVSTTDDLDKRLAELEVITNGTKSPTTSTISTQPRTIEQIVQDAPGPDLNQIQFEATGAPPTTTEGTLDFALIYKQAKLPGASYTAEQTLAMLAQLPENLPLEIKRQTVGVMLASLGASMGATPETIVADASRKLAALAAFVTAQQSHTESFVAAAEFEIAELQKQVEDKRMEIKASTDSLVHAQTACDAEADRLDDILEFFSLDIGPSKYAPPQ